MSEIAGKVLGWLLGLLAPGLKDRIAGKYKARRAMGAIVVELEERGWTFALAAFTLRTQLGTVDQAFAEWLASVANRYHGVDASDPGMAGLRDPRAVLATAASKPPKPGRGLDMKRYTVAALDAHAEDLPYCPEDFQRRIAQLRETLALYNADVDRAQEDAARTFDKDLSPANHAATLSNLQQTYSRLSASAESFARQAFATVDSHDARRVRGR